MVYTPPQVVTGGTLQPGVYMENAYIRDLSATAATLGHFKSAPSGSRVEIEDDRTTVFREDGRVAVKIGNLD